MIGAIVGDIIGSRFEFNNTNRTDFDLFTSESSYTDDTICTIAIAEATLNGGIYKESLLKWCRKYPDPKGDYGGAFKQWIDLKKPEPYNSYGNGSAMRVSPIGWAFDHLEDVLEQAKLSAAVTHNHPEGIKGAQCIASLIYLLRTGKIDIGSIAQYIKCTFNYDILAVDTIREINTYNETCQITVPQAISCLVEAKDFEQTIRLAISIGGDSDTIAAIAGSLAEAIPGMKIPRHMLDCIQKLPTEMVDVIDEFWANFR